MSTLGRRILATMSFVLLCNTQLFIEAEGGKILGVFEWPGRSHFLMFEALLKELASRGHQVTVVSHFPQTSPVENYTDISLVGSVPLMIGGFSVQNMLEFGAWGVFDYFRNIHFERWVKIMEHHTIKNLLNSTEEYDVVIMELGGTDCTYGFAWKLGAPVIGITSFTGMWNLQYRMGFMENPAYFPLWVLPYSTGMNFWQRVVNTYWWLVAVLGDRVLLYPKINQQWRRLVGPEIPPVEELVQNTSLILVNSHFSLDGALPRVPTVVDVGGMHIKEVPDELPQPLRDFLDGADASGAVYMSFGSLARAEEMPLPQLGDIVAVLGSLPQRVVWKCDGETVSQRLGYSLPQNIFSAPWMPQADILAHPNVKVFVSHGGLMGTQEAVYWGKPMLIMPLFADQPQNAVNLKNHGVAVLLEFYDITKESFRVALETLFLDESYAVNARRLSRLFRDRPLPPLQEAVIWTEYVMNHRGAFHMRSAAINIHWWQHCLLDVAATFVAAIVIVVGVIIVLLRKFFALFSVTTPKKLKCS